MPPQRRSASKTPRKNDGINNVVKMGDKRARKRVPDDDPNPILKQVTDPSLDAYRISMPNANVLYIPDLLDLNISKQWYSDLSKLSTWYRPTLKVYGKSVVQSRQIAAYATDQSLVHKYSGTIVEMHTDYPPVLTSIQTLVEQKLGVEFNHVMLNRYDSGDVYIGLHADNLENRIIATVSLGVERTFIMRHRTLKGDAGTRRWKLQDGSVFVMQGDTQQLWKNE